jgi:hypothetical protein
MFISRSSLTDVVQVFLTQTDRLFQGVEIVRVSKETEYMYDIFGMAFSKTTKIGFL